VLASSADTPPDYGDRPAIDEGAWEPEDLLACPVAERSMSEIFGELVAAGLEPQDIGALERLDDAAVRRRLGTHTSNFQHSDRQNVIAYLRAWAALLEEALADTPSAAPNGTRDGAATWDEWLGVALLPAAAE